MIELGPAIITFLLAQMVANIIAWAYIGVKVARVETHITHIFRSCKCHKNTDFDEPLKVSKR